MKELAATGNILRYLKCCKLDPSIQPPEPRYPNLKLVFVTSRIYGGYAKNPENPPNPVDNVAGCLNPEPFARGGLRSAAADRGP